MYLLSFVDAILINRYKNYIRPRTRSVSKDTRIVESANEWSPRLGTKESYEFSDDEDSRDSNTLKIHAGSRMMRMMGGREGGAAARETVHQNFSCISCCSHGHFEYANAASRHINRTAACARGGKYLCGPLK